MNLNSSQTPDPLDNNEELYSRSDSSVGCMGWDEVKTRDNDVKRVGVVF